MRVCKRLDFSEDISLLPCEQSHFDLICNLFALDLTALSRVKLSSSVEKKNMSAGKARRSLQGRVAQSRMSKSIKNWAVATM